MAETGQEPAHRPSRGAVVDLLRLVAPAVLPGAPPGRRPSSAAGWESLLAEARSLGLSPHLLPALSRDGSAALPPEVLSSLGDSYRRAAARGELVRRELGTVLDAFREASLRTMVLKGPCLAELFHRDWALRPMADFDLLVPEEEMPRAFSLAVSLGYRPDRPLHLENERRYHDDLGFTRPGSLPLDIHWALEIPSSPFAIDLGGVWARALTAGVAGRTALVPAPEDLVLHLVIHDAFHHRLALGPRPLLDLAAVVSSPGFPWEALAQRADQWGAHRALTLLLAAVERSLGPVIPPVWRSSLAAPADVEPWLDLALDQILAPPPSPAGVTFHLAHVTSGRGGASRARTLVRALIPPPGLLAARHGISPRSPLLPLLYPWRLAVLTFRYAGTLLSLARDTGGIRRRLAREEELNRLVAFLAGGEGHPYRDI